MTIDKMTEAECLAALAQLSVGRLGCSLDNQPYVVPIFFAYEAGYIYAFSTFGQKIEWMRANPKVCIQAEDMADQSHWMSIITNGKYEELPTQAWTHARQLLEKQHGWWLNALAQRRTKVDDLSIEPVFFRIQVDSMTGLRASDYGKSLR